MIGSNTLLQHRFPRWRSRSSFEQSKLQTGQQDVVAYKQASGKTTDTRNSDHRAPPYLTLISLLFVLEARQQIVLFSQEKPLVLRQTKHGIMSD